MTIWTNAHYFHAFGFIVKDCIIQMNEIGERLRAERQRLGLNQDEFGALGGVARNAQSHYEKGIRNPDSVYLAAVAKVGVDVQYVLTGKRTDSPDSLAPREAALVEHYRKCTPERRQSLEEMAAALAKLSADEGGAKG